MHSPVEKNVFVLLNKNKIKIFHKMYKRQLYCMQSINYFLLVKFHSSNEFYLHWKCLIENMICVLFISKFTP